MIRKRICLLLACSALWGCLVVAHAADVDTAAYDRAAELLSENGIAPTAETALTQGRGMAAAEELGLLAEGEPVMLSQLGALALVEQQARQQAAADAAHEELLRSAYLALYDGVVLERSTTLRSAPHGDASALRTLAAGKAAQLRDITEDGWYKITFAGTTGYVSADACRGVDYDDYKNTPAARDLTAELLAHARTWLGTPYVYGGASKSGTDCSGFTMRCFAAVGCSLSHGARSQYAAAKPVTVAQRKAGDLVFFTGPGQSGITHVGIYLGSGRFIHASTSRGVTIDNIDGPYFSRYYVGAGRILP